MKKLAVITLIVLVIASIGCAKGYEVTKNAGEYSVSLKMEKSTPTVGDNLMMVAVKDTTGKPVTDASITVEYSMPAMPGMPAMNYSTEAASHGTEYHATLNFSMPGAWSVVIKITRAEKTTTVNFNVDVQ